MPPAPPRPFDVVALLSERPDLGLARGQVGAVVDVSGRLALVEFTDSDGKTVATVSADADDLLVLTYDAVPAE